MQRLSNSLNVQQSPSLRQLLRGMRNHICSVLALDVEYSYEQRDRETGEEIVLSGEYRYAHWGIAQLRTASTQWSNESSAPSPVQWLWDGNACKAYHPDGRILHVTSKKERRIDQDSYVGIVLQKYHRFLSRPNTAMLLVERCVRRNDVRLEKLNGQPCYIFDAIHYTQRFWVDPACNFALRRWEVYDRKGCRDFTKKSLVIRVDYNNLRPAAENTWLPWEVRVETHLAKHRGEQIPTVTQSMIVHKVAVNENVDGELFQATYPPGTYVLDDLRRSAYRIGPDGNPTGQVDLDTGLKIAV